MMAGDWIGNVECTVAGPHAGRLPRHELTISL